MTLSLMQSKSLVKEIAELCENYQLGVLATTIPANRTIYVGEIPDTAEDALGVPQPIPEALWIVESPSPPPHSYVDTEYTVLDFWSRSPHSDRGHALLEMVYNNFHRRYHYETRNWHIAFSHALGSIVDVDRDLNGSKLYRLSVQFICRNLNNLS